MPEDKIEKNISSNIENIEDSNEKLRNQETLTEIIDTKSEKLLEKKVEESAIVTEKSSQIISKGSFSLTQSTHREREKQIENILEIDLAEIYLNLSPENKKKFKFKGEETARAISNLLDESKIKIKKIMNLIKDWLKIIPGINKYFVEQLTKNKLDEIMKLKNK